MNIYSYEIKSQLRTYIIWSVSILVVFLIFMSGLYHVFMDSRADVEKAYSGFPPAFSAAFGIVIEQIFTYGGFFQFIYTYIAIIGAIMAAAVAISAFSREKRSKCVDFLLTKPVGRGAIFTAKLLAGLTMLAVTNILFVAVSILVHNGSGQDAAQLDRAVWASCALFFMQLVFLSIGALYATFAKKVRSVPGIATALGFAGFILSALYSLLREDAIRFISPLTYFQPYAVFSTGGFETRYAVTAAAVAVACIGLSYVKYCKYDVPAL
ncbi:ABC-2 type transport system permease protein [Sporobacter termitidis DSM 10068]|uniref:ABC-2 type transport system permease protein n=1 Tax=Sporobacter termitidis DSM 10068 TaxID=1123282 RepID=A0A1M5WW92_9FIRM|nr:ABC transporter permease subunit [Sporobacter termitidis]SHH91869.1 ABC-2 type transport system permease protein [Sporobacter termitidis DSM 10068]